MINIETVLKDQTTQLDGRVTVLEENGGSGNSSVAELEMRMERLEESIWMTIARLMLLIVH